MKILGLDPALRCTGFGVIHCQGKTPYYLSSGCIKTDSTQPLAQRLGILADSVHQLIELYAPDIVAIEEVFVNQNPRSTLLLGQARGALIAAVGLKHCPIVEYAPLLIKKTIVGYGRATKEQVQMMVTRLLQLEGTPQADAADALACALCHLYQSA